VSSPYSRQIQQILGYTQGGVISGPGGISLSYGPDKPGPEFTGLPFDLALGEVYGLRVWKVDKYGRLRARHVETAKPWRPGVNVAKCHAVFGIGTEAHESPDEKCTCGFYAYTEPDHIELQLTGRGQGPFIMGVVKATGRTLLGTQGFRSEKAEIVALQSPAGTGEGPKSSPDRKLADRLRVVYPEVPFFGTRAGLLGFAPVKSMLPEPGEEGFWELP
jgi:hypothetical protein